MSESQARDRFFALHQSSNSHYISHMEYRASHILVKDKALAERLLKQIKGGARFEELAKDFSTCPSKSKGGDLGWFGPGKMVKEFEAACAKLSPGRLAPVVKTQFGYHVIKLTGRK